MFLWALDGGNNHIIVLNVTNGFEYFTTIDTYVDSNSIQWGFISPNAFALCPYGVAFADTGNSKVVLLYFDGVFYRRVCYLRRRVGRCLRPAPLGDVCAHEKFMGCDRAVFQHHVWDRRPGR